MKFLDKAKIFVKSGDGGDGCVSFHREKFLENGGPDGGGGGCGGHIIIRVQRNLNTLIDYRYHQHFKAPKGGNGAGKSRTGAKGKTLFLDVPPGTQVWDSDKQNLLLEMFDGEKMLLKGGQGGQGNESFKSSTRQSPRIAQKGAKGEEMWIWLHLKLLADVGLVGLPNAGKSTLLSVLTQARPKIGDYPFTTLYPNLGTIATNTHTFVIADIPGLIENAHKGKGLGHRFLGHIERCRVLLHVLDITSDTLEQDYLTIQKELDHYGMGTSSKKMFILLNKVDLLEEAEQQERYKKVKKTSQTSVFLCSAKEQQKLPSLISALQKELLLES